MSGADLLLLTVMEVMELQLERRKREEHRLRAELDAAGRQISELNFNHRQIQSEVSFEHFSSSF